MKTVGVTLRQLRLIMFLCILTTTSALAVFLDLLFCHSPLLVQEPRLLTRDMALHASMILSSVVFFSILTFWLVDTALGKAVAK